MSRIESALRDEANYTANRAPKESADEWGWRRLKYQPRGEGVYLCPKCWIKNEQRSSLRSIPSNSDDDILACNSCGSEFVV